MGIRSKEARPGQGDGYANLHCRSVCTGVNGESSFDAEDALSHPAEPKVNHRRAADLFWVEACSIIPHRKLERPGGLAQLDPHVAGVCVLQAVCYRLLTDAEDLFGGILRDFMAKGGRPLYGVR